MREKGLAAPVDPLDDRLVLLVAVVATEADDGEPPRCAELPPRLVTHEPLEQLGKPDGVPDACLQALAPVAAQHRPELERAKAAAERRTVVGETLRFVTRTQVLRHETEGGTQRFG